MHLQCTKKVLDFLKPECRSKDTDEDFYAWHVQYITVNRRKLFLFMNDLTRFSVVLYGLKKSDFLKIEEHFKIALKACLEMENYDALLIEHYLSNIRNVTYDKTKNRHLVARLNRTSIDLSWDLEHLDLNQEVQRLLSKRLNHMPVGENNWKIVYFPYHKMREYLELLKQD